MTNSVAGLEPEVLRIIRRHVVKDPNKAAGSCEKVADRLRWRLIEAAEPLEGPPLSFGPDDVKVISGWYRPAAPQANWAGIWRFGHGAAEEVAIDHTWVWIKILGIYVDPTVAQFGDGEGGLQICRRDDPRYLLVHPRTGEKAFHYVRLG